MPTNQITVQNQNIGFIEAGAAVQNINITPPTISGVCADTGFRTIVAIDADVSLYKDTGLETEAVLSVGDTFLSTSVLTLNIADPDATLGSRTLFTYKATGACGDSNIAVISGTVTDAIIPDTPVPNSYSGEVGSPITGTVQQYGTLIIYYNGAYEATIFLQTTKNFSYTPQKVGNYSFQLANNSNSSAKSANVSVVAKTASTSSILVTTSQDTQNDGNANAQPFKWYHGVAVVAIAAVVVWVLSKL